MPQQATTLYQTMFDAVCRTFESMAFAEVEKQSDAIDLKAPAELVWTSILIHNPLQGEIRLALAQSLLTEISATMFCLEPEEIVEERKRDILAEILNTLAGLFMTHLLPDDETYQLGLPQAGEGPVPESEENSIIWHLQVDGKPLLLTASGFGLIKEINDSVTFTQFN